MMASSKALVALFIIFGYVGVSFGQSSAVWGYECVNSRCIRRELSSDSNSKAVSLPICRIFCGDDPGTIWPKPTGRVIIDNIISRINIAAVRLNVINDSKANKPFWDANEARFLDQINRKLPKSIKLDNQGNGLVVNIDVVHPDDLTLTLQTNESYVLSSTEKDGNVVVTINAETVFGARHGLETLSQLVVFDDIRSELQMPKEFTIEDKPFYVHRGLLLDTSRNYYTVESIKRTIDGMAMSKLNTFHWHITDSQSFPLVLESHPDLSRLGAYNQEKVYKAEDITEIYNYALVRGVIVLPEFDAPAHVGEGWQKKGLVSCFNYQPWQNYCVEPPCGQLDPTQNKLYDVLEDIYTEMFKLFRNPSVFHMGGDEVSHSCWNSSITIQNWMKQQGWGLDEADFMKLWGHFQDNALARVDKVANSKLPIIMWTSRLTDVPYVSTYLDKSRYIIQIWTTGTDSKITDLLERGYKIIMSNYDALYFDCGFGAWVTAGNNWCSPYIGWEKVYNNNFATLTDKYQSQILGAEAALWSEQSDENVIDSRFWPRASALGERLWSNPQTSWRDAEPRMLIHRERLVQNGIQADSIQPQWCLQHEGDCPIGK